MARCVIYLPTDLFLHRVGQMCPDLYSIKQHSVSSTEERFSRNSEATAWVCRKKSEEMYPLCYIFIVIYLTHSKRQSYIIMLPVFKGYKSCSTLYIIVDDPLTTSSQYLDTTEQSFFEIVLLPCICFICIDISEVDASEFEENSFYMHRLSCSTHN